MAKRRSLHTKISLSLDVEGMSEWAQLLWDRVIVHADDFGRLPGEPAVVKALCKPLSLRPVGDFATALGEMARAGLILRYRAGGHIYIQVVKWDEHQEGLHKRTKSDFPEVPSDLTSICDEFREVPGSSGNLPEVPASCARAERKRNETKGREGNAREDAAPPTPFLADCGPSEQAIIDALRSVEGYSANDAADAKIVRTLAEEFPTVDLLAAARGWAAYKLDKPLQPKSSPRSQFRSWVRIEAERLAEVRNGHHVPSGANGGAPLRGPALASPASAGPTAPGDRPWLLPEAEQAEIQAMAARGECW